MKPRNVCYRIFSCTLLLLGSGVSLPAWSAEETFSIIAPRAVTSTLIDIDRAGDRLVAVGERGHVLYSLDQGENWQQAKVPFRRMLTGVAFVSDKLGWAVGHQSMIFKTVDGGETWQLAVDGFDLQEDFNRTNVERTRKAYEALVIELDEKPDPSRDLELEDALFAFEDAEILLEEPTIPTNLHDVWFLDEKTGFAVGSFGRLVQTRDGGKNWTETSHLLDNPDGFHLNGIAGSAAAGVFIAGEGGVLYRSTDLGETWESLDAGYFDTFFGVVFDAGNQLLTAFGLGSALFQSADLGQNWQALNSPIKATFAGGAVGDDGSTILVGPAGTVLTIKGSSITSQAQSDRGNYSAVLPLGADKVMIVGAGGPRRVTLK